MPWTVDGRQRNRAWLLLPDGRAIHQDKLCLTPDEQDPNTWLLEPGDSVQIVEWDGLTVATLVCLDVEMPALSSLLAPHRPDLLLVPSMTLRRSGHARVFGCAKARAVELMCAVAVTGVVGATPGTTWNPTNVSGNAVYLPCEKSLGYTGVHSETPAVEDHWGDGPFLLARDIPVGAIRALRDSGSEVWPGAWTAGHIAIRSA
jgi:predicted amidohydrolase